MFVNFLGIFQLMSIPTTVGITMVARDVATFTYGMAILESLVHLPVKIKISNGIIPIARIVEHVVMQILRETSPREKYVNRLDMDPPGQHVRITVLIDRAGDREKACASPNPVIGIIANCTTKPTITPYGFFITDIKSFSVCVAPIPTIMNTSVAIVRIWSTLPRVPLNAGAASVALVPFVAFIRSILPCFDDATSPLPVPGLNKDGECLGF